jgi:hypothetical protein
VQRGCLAASVLTQLLPCLAFHTAGSSEWEDADGAEDDEPPSFEFRFECAKLLLELDESTDAAIQVCGGGGRWSSVRCAAAGGGGQRP